VWHQFLWVNCIINHKTFELCQTTEAAAASKATRKANKAAPRVAKVVRAAKVKVQVLKVVTSNKEAARKSSKVAKEARAHVAATRERDKVATNIEEQFLNLC
jgi:hypothetical protein